MTDESLLAALDGLQARFLAAIQAGEWEEAQQLERQRFALVDVLSREAPLNERVARDLAGILEADRQVLPQVEAALADTAAALRDLRQGRCAADAYAAAAR